MNEKKPPSNRKGARHPAPAHPHLRREPLPWCNPKAQEDDPDAPERVAALLASPSYRQADQDVDFLNRQDTRGLRLQVDYLKPELLLEQHGITDTIIVYGSTRIPEPAAAQRNVDRLRRALAEEPSDRERQRRLAVAERVLTRSRYYGVARELGRLVGNAGRGPGDSRVVIMTGGGPGIMEAA